MISKPLGKIADVLISNVDKKSKAGEQEVRLCNFTDVYYNWAISSYNNKDFMIATASSSAIEKFTLHKGDVAITKDSETRDDIGVATYISEDIENLILGYHCILIRPDENVVLGKYLNVVLHSPYAQKYFEANASGSGQRYTLTDSIVKEMPIPLPDIEIQRKIGEIPSYIDRKIENNNKMNAELEAMARTIYEYWFLQFDYPNGEGKPYKASGGEMIWNEELKRDIPRGWSVKCLNEIEGDIVTGKTPSTKDDSNFGDDIPFITIGDIRGNMYVAKTEQSLSLKGAESQANKYIPEESICVTCIATPGLVGIATKKSQTNQQINSVVCRKSYSKFYLYFAIRDFFRFSAGAKAGNTFDNMNKADFSAMRLINPSSDVLIEYEKIVSSLFDMVRRNSEENQELLRLREFLLPMLISGQVNFGK